MVESIVLALVGVILFTEVILLEYTHEGILKNIYRLLWVGACAYHMNRIGGTTYRYSWSRSWIVFHDLAGENRGWFEEAKRWAEEEFD